YASLAASRFATDHNEIMIEYPDLEEFLPQLVRCFDEPFADAAAVPTYLIAREASHHLKVVLSGNGGDELFAGYAKYLAEPMACMLSYLPASFRSSILAPLAELLPVSTAVADPVRRLKRILRYSLLPPSMRPISWLNGFDEETLRKLLARDVLNELKDFDPLAVIRRFFDSTPDADTLSRLLFTEFNSYLPSNNLHKDDILGMAHSLEIRVPFLDHRLVELAFTIPSSLKLRGFKTKYILKKSLRGLLPAEILYRPKQGFSAPVGEWIKGKLRPLCEGLFFQKNSETCSYFNQDEIRTLFNEHLRGHADHSHRLWALLILFVWFQNKP
ncbi:MAG: asparagine synthase C-terminal domain-containing protein, partial [bacterium]